MLYLSVCADCLGVCLLDACRRRGMLPSKGALSVQLEACVRSVHAASAAACYHLQTAVLVSVLPQR